MKRAAAKVVPKLPNFEQNQSRMNITQEMLTTFNDDQGLLKKVITADKSWMYSYEMKSKPNHPNGSVQKSQGRKKHLKVLFNVKVFLTVFFNCNGVVHYEFLASRQYGQEGIQP